MEVYRFRNTKTGKEYYGISKDARRRRYGHVYSVRRGCNTPFYSAVRKYGWPVFEFEILYEGLSPEEAADVEIQLIRVSKEKGLSYNLHLGGSIGFDIRTKSEEDVNAWRQKLISARKGKTPALGMKHTDEAKKLFSQCSKYRWDLYGRYPEDVLSLSFIESNKKYGISKTHYYRLRKARALRNEQS